MWIRWFVLLVAITLFVRADEAVRQVETRGRWGVGSDVPWTEAQRRLYARWYRLAAVAMGGLSLADILGLM